MMKEHKKWLKRQPISIREHMSPSYYMGLEHGWKVALEWVLNGFDEYVQKWDVEIMDDIKEELKDE